MKHLYLNFLIFSVIACSNLFAQSNIRFIENKGQWENPFLYKANLGGGSLFIEKNAFTYNFYNANEYQFHHLNVGMNKTSRNSEKQLRFHAFKVNFLNINSSVKISSTIPYPEYYNYFLGSDKNRWKSKVKAYQKINYNELYPNINLEIYSVGNALKYDVIVNSGGKVNNVQLSYKGVDKIELDENGNLLIITSVNQLTEQKPYAYQLIEGKKVEIPSKFVLKDNIVSFKLLKSYNKKIPLIIDPVLIFSSYSGSFADNFGMSATYGTDGSLFAGGTVFNVGYPVTLGAFDPSFNGFPATGITDVAISRYDSTGTSLIYSTYLGGVQAETVHSMITNDNNELYLYGVTSSIDFPVLSNAYDTTFNGGKQLRFVNNGTFFNAGTDIYVAKLNASGTSLLGGTYIGGTNNDGVNHSNDSTFVFGIWSPKYDSLQNNYSDQYRGEIFLDKNNDCYIASSTRSSDFPIVNGFDNTLGGKQDGIVFKLDNNLTTLKWSSYLGGSEMDAGYSLKVDTANFVYVSGGTTSLDFPTTSGTIDTTYQGGKADGYLAKIDSSGSSIIAATYIGTNDYDQCYFIDIDRFGSVYTIGQTRGVFPVFNAAYSNPNSGQFIARYNNNLTTTDYSTVFGNNNVNAYFSPSAFLVDRCQNVYVSGWGGNILGGSALVGMPVTFDALQPTSGDGFNFYLFVLERNAQSQLYGTYFGGGISEEHVDGGTSRFDKNGIVYQSVCAGCGSNDDFPTTSGVVSNINNSSNCNNGVFKFDFEIVPEAFFTVDTFLGCAPLTITFSNSSGVSDKYLWDFGNGDTTSQIFNPVKVYPTPGVYDVSLLIIDSICNTVDTAFQTITVAPPITVTPDSALINSCGGSTTLSVSTTGGPVSFIWSSNNLFTDTLNTSLADSILATTIIDTTTFYIKATNGICFATDSIVVNYIGVEIATSNIIICTKLNTALNVTSLQNDTLTYVWTPTSKIISGDTTANPIVNPDSSTTYYVTAQNTYGCTANDSVMVVVPTFKSTDIIITADRDSLFDKAGTNLHVTPNTGFTYLWSPDVAINNITSTDPFVNPTTTTTYTVELTDNVTGCKYYQSDTIYVFETICEEPNVFVPNAFTPNSDNENDILYVRGPNVLEMHIEIFDRWGEKVFESKDQTVGWDGFYKNELVEPGVFVYYLTVVCIDQQKYFKKGNVTVIR